MSAPLGTRNILGTKAKDVDKPMEGSTVQGGVAVRIRRVHGCEVPSCQDRLRLGGLQMVNLLSQNPGPLPPGLGRSFGAFKRGIMDLPR